MLIRSQDKRKIINLENILQISINDGCFYVTGLICSIGEYNSNEEAISVLDKICDAYENEQYTTDRYNGMVEVPYIYKDNTVFNMPPKEDSK
jgi:hypothetical protein